MADTMREAFEEWMSEGGKWPRSIERNSVGQYVLSTASTAWRVWQAAHEAGRQLATGTPDVTVPSPQPDAERVSGECRWTPDDDGTYWTSCGQGFIFNDESGPKEHDMRFCCYCGRGIGTTEQAKGQT